MNIVKELDKIAEKLSPKFWDLDTFEREIVHEIFKDYKEIIININNRIDKEVLKIPKTEYNRQGNPKSIVDAITNSTNRRMIKTVKELISKEIKLKVKNRIKG